MSKSSAVVIVLATALISTATVLTGPGARLRVEISGTGDAAQSVISIDDNGAWVPALRAPGSPVRVIETNGTLHLCVLQQVKALVDRQGILEESDCGVGKVERRIAATSDSDVLDISVIFEKAPDMKIRSVEDRYEFAPGRRESSTPLSGPVDFVWSQNIRNEPGSVIPNWSFKSPAVMLQQGPVFAALLPGLDNRLVTPLAIDLNVTSDPKPWFSYGAVPSEPYGHSYFRRSAKEEAAAIAGSIQYAYSIVASAQPQRLGYRRVTHLLWKRTGHDQLLSSNDLQRNSRRPYLELFSDWEKEAWVRYADQVYREFDCGLNKKCGTLVSNRNVWGEWNKPAPDAWFNSWFQTLRTAYGWHLYGRRTNNPEIMRKAETVLNLALDSPQKDGAFPTIYLVNDRRWIPEDGWAGFPESYHTFCMSWTAWWMLEWEENLTPARKNEVLAFTRKYGDFLVAHQLANGAIPSWFDASLKARPEFGDFNAETAGSALFLLELARETGNRVYADAGRHAMEFVTREVLPRQRWFDFETFKSCARKDFGFYDPWTAQYPQNNLSTMQAAMAYLALYRTTRESKYLEQGTEVLDYLLLTQQVWNNPAFSPKLVGGFTTQNTDAEWSDARQCYAAVLLLDYYRETGNPEYVERAVAAARSTFAVAPWENWAHTGYRDREGALTGFHWGTGSAMTSVEIMTPLLGDAFVDLARQHGAGFNACSIREVTVNGASVSFELETLPRLDSVRVRFAGVDPTVTYLISWNHRKPVAVAGRELATEGFLIRSQPPAQQAGSRPR